MRYVFDVVFQQTNCLKKDVEFSSLSIPNNFKEKCLVAADAAEVPAKFSIWTKSWKNFVQVSEIKDNEVNQHSDESN